MTSKVYIQCPNCLYAQDVPSKEIPQSAVSVKCPKCGNRINLSSLMNTPPKDPPETAATIIETAIPKQPAATVKERLKEGVTIQISALRHPKESVYFTISAIVGGIAWLGLIWVAILFFWIIIPLVIAMWLAKQYFEAHLLGNSIYVNKGQYPKVFEMVEKQCQTLNIRKKPKVFVIEEEGAKNAIAVKLFDEKYILLRSGLVNAMLLHDAFTELGSIIGHELGHHAAGHFFYWKRLLLRPAYVIPFLASAYSRSCELTADRIGAYLCGDKDAACRALTVLAGGNIAVINVAAFKGQESLLSPFFAFINDLYATHPRLTKRVLELETMNLPK